MPSMNEGTTTGPFLVTNGASPEIAKDIEEKYGHGPCVRIPALQGAWEAAKAYLATLDEKAQRELGYVRTAGGRRRQRRHRKRARK